MTRVYILHGWTYSTDKWQPLIAWLRQHGIEPVMLNVPGLTSPSTKVWDIKDYVAWLNNSTQHETGPFILIGHSNGGRIALNFAIQYPRRLHRLILIDSAGIYHDEPSVRLKRFVFGLLAKIGKKFTRSRHLRTLLYKVARAEDYRQAPPNMRQTMANLQASDQHLRLASIRTPTTIIWGGQDKMTPLSDGQAMARHLKTDQLLIISEARHSPFFTHPAETGRIIRETLQ